MAHRIGKEHCPVPVKEDAVYGPDPFALAVGISVHGDLLQGFAFAEDTGRGLFNPCGQGNGLQARAADGVFLYGFQGGGQDDLFGAVTIDSPFSDPCDRQAPDPVRYRQDFGTALVVCQDSLVSRPGKGPCTLVVLQRHRIRLLQPGGTGQGTGLGGMNSAVDIKELQLQDKGLLSVYLRNMTNLQTDRSVFRKVKEVAAYSVALPVPVRKRLHGPVFIAGGKIGTAEDIEQTAVILHIQGILAGCRAVNSLDRLDPDLSTAWTDWTLTWPSSSSAMMAAF